MDVGLAWSPLFFLFFKGTHPLECTSKATDKANLPHGHPVISRNGVHQGTFESPSQPKIVTFSNDTFNDLASIKDVKDVSASLVSRNIEDDQKISEVVVPNVSLSRVREAMTTLFTFIKQQ